mgnify:CR=1 FL=1
MQFEVLTASVLLDPPPPQLQSKPVNTMQKITFFILLELPMKEGCCRCC